MLRRVVKLDRARPFHVDIGQLLRRHL